MKTVLFILLFCIVVSITACSKSQSDEKVLVDIQTQLGTLQIEVYPQRAPLTAADFLSYVDQGLFDGQAFYRVVRDDNDRNQHKISVVQGGLIGIDGERSPIAHESTQQSGLHHVDGTVSVARGEVGTARASAFFISIGDNPELDFGGQRNPDGFGFAAFGKIVTGMDIVRKIQAMPADAPSESSYTRGQLLTEPVKIVRAQRITGN